MNAGAANLTLPQDRNWTTETFAFCSRPYIVLKLFLQFIFIMYSFPANIVVIVELLKRSYRKRKDRSIYFSSSLSEVFLLHISFISVFHSFSLLLLWLQEMNICNVSGHFVDILYGPDFTAVPLFLVAICVDCYLAVIYPVAYMAAKNIRHRGLLYTTPVWVYALVMWAITIIYDLHYFHPVSMLSFYVSLPAVLFFSVSTLRALYSTRPGSSNQALSPTKRRAFHIILSILVVRVAYYLPQVSFFTYRFVEPTDSVRFQCLEYPLVMMLPTVCDFMTPLLFLYCAGKVGTAFCRTKA